MPFGNKLIEIDYSSPSGLWQIMGPNGVGKSSIRKILGMGIYYDYSDIPVDEIANHINGDGYIDIGLNSNGHDWSIETFFTGGRRIKGGKLKEIKVHKDGVEQDFGNVQATKETIMKDVVDIPFHIFNNTISLSVDDFKSFLKMNAKDSRNIRDRLFGFFILNEMLIEIRKDINIKISEIDALNIKIESISSNKVEVESQYNAAITEYKEKSKDAKAELIEILKQLNDKKDILTKDIKTLKYQIGQYKRILGNQEIRVNQDDLKRLNDAFKDIDSKIKGIKSGSDTLNQQKSKIEAELSEFKKVEDYLSYNQKVNQIDDAKDSIKFKNERLGEFKQIMDRYNKLDKFVNDNNEYVKHATDFLVKIDALILNLANLKSIKQEYESLGVKNNEMQDARDKIKKIISDTEKDIELFQNYVAVLEKGGDCPTCGTNLTNQDHSKRIQSYKDSLNVCREKLVKAEGMLDKALSNRSIIQDKMEKMTYQINNIRNQMTKDDTMVSNILIQINESQLYGRIKESEYTKELLNMEGIVGIRKRIEESDQIIGVAQKEMEGINFNEVKKNHAELELEISGIQKELYSLEKETALVQDDVKSLSYPQYENKVWSYKSVIQYEESVDQIKRTLDSKYKEKIEAESKQTNNIDKINKINEYLKVTAENEIDPEYQKYMEQSAESLKTNMTAIENMIESKNSGLNDINISIAQNQTKCDAIKEDDLSSYENMKTLISTYSIQIDEIGKEIKDKKKIQSALELFEYSISDEGFKSFMIKNIIPSINKEVSYILNELEIPLVVKFDNEFKPSVYRFGEEVSLSSISTGQTKMIDTAILISITKMLKSKYGVNVIFYDEIFSSLHPVVVNTLLGIIKETLVKKMGLHVNVINHAHMKNSEFDYVIDITNAGNFSDVDICEQAKYVES